MHKAKNIYFLLIKKKKTKWPKAGSGLKQDTFPYTLRLHCEYAAKVYRGERGNGEHLSQSQD